VGRVLPVGLFFLVGICLLLLDYQLFHGRLRRSGSATGMAELRPYRECHGRSDVWTLRELHICHRDTPRRSRNAALAGTRPTRRGAAFRARTIERSVVAVTRLHGSTRCELLAAGVHLESAKKMRIFQFTVAIRRTAVALRRAQTQRSAEIYGICQQRVTRQPSSTLRAGIAFPTERTQGA